MELYAILNETQDAVVEVIEVLNGEAYKDIVFKKDGTIQDRKDVGLYHVINIIPETVEFQRAVEKGFILDHTEKTATMEYEVQDFSFEEKYLTEMYAWKNDRENNIRNLEVVYNGIIYQGDEISQTRMARAILALPDDVTTMDWTAKDNTVHPLNRLDLKAILFDAGIQQSAIWNTGRPVLGA